MKKFCNKKDFKNVSLDSEVFVKLTVTSFEDGKETDFVYVKESIEEIFEKLHGSDFIMLTRADIRSKLFVPFIVSKDCVLNATVIKIEDVKSLEQFDNVIPFPLKKD